MHIETDPELSTQDVEDLRSLFRTTTLHAYQNLLPQQALRTLLDLIEETNMPQLMPDAHETLCVARDGKTLLGTIVGTPHGRLLNLRTLNVHPQAQGQGIGRQLVAKVTTAHPQTTTHRLLALTADTGVQTFWERLGFSITGKTRLALTAQTQFDLTIRSRTVKA